jgi:hypothetical protein
MVTTMLPIRGGSVYARRLALILAFPVVGCATSTAPVEIRVEGGEAGCIVEAEGRSYTGETLAAWAPRWRGRGAIIRPGPDASYRCIGGTIFVLQRAGLRRIDTPDLPPAP